MQSDLKFFYEQYLINCIGQQCAKTREHIDKYRAYFANNRHSSGFSDTWKQLTFALSANRSEGAYIYDLDGNKYLDITMGFGVHLFGHSPLFIKEAIVKQLEKGISLGPVHQDAAETAALICQLTNNERCAFFNSGTEAVMVALRLARAATGRSKIIIFEGAYHGTHDSLLAIKQHPVTKEAIGSIPGISPSLLQDTILLPFGKKESIDFIERHGSEIAAVLTEPVRSRYPEEVNPTFLHQLQQLCVANNICFILDEVITGFRVSNGGAKAVFGLDTDMVVYGKVLGGGLPIGVVAGKKKYLNYIDGGNWRFSDTSFPNSPTTFVAGTFCHHPLAMATSRATLLFLQANNNELQDTLNQKTTEFCRSINDFCQANRFPVQVDHFGSMFRLQVKGKNRILYHALLKEKIYIWEGRTCFLSGAHQPDDLDHLESAIKKSFVETRSAGFFAVIGPGEKIRHTNAFFLQTAFEVNEQLDISSIHFAFNFACETIQATNNINLQREFIFIPHPGSENTLHEIPRKKTADLRLIISYQGTKTLFQLQFSKIHFDGWSLNLFTQFLSNCFLSLEKGQPLPVNKFLPISFFEKWVNADPYKKSDLELFAASTIHLHLPVIKARYRGTLFEYLLSCFAISLGEGEFIIGVPVSGQLVSRYIRTVGACTCQVPLSLCITKKTTMPGLMSEVSNQLLKAKKDFRKFYNKEHQPYRIVFNMDDPGNNFSFANRQTTFVNSDDTHTCHDLVCNVMVEPGGLHVSVKYKQDAATSEKILNKFSKLLTQEHEDIFTYSK